MRKQQQPYLGSHIASVKEGYSHELYEYAKSLVCKLASHLRRQGRHCSFTIHGCNCLHTGEGLKYMQCYGRDVSILQAYCTNQISHVSRVTVTLAQLFRNHAVTLLHDLLRLETKDVNHPSSRNTPPRSQA